MSLYPTFTRLFSTFRCINVDTHTQYIYCVCVYNEALAACRLMLTMGQLPEEMVPFNPSLDKNYSSAM